MDSEGVAFQRTTPTAISSMDPSVPEVDTAKVTRGYYDETAVVQCHVTSPIPFTVQWYRNAVELGNRLFYRFNPIASLNFYYCLRCYYRYNFLCSKYNIVSSQSAETKEFKLN